MQKIADGQPWKMPATIDDPAAIEEITGGLLKDRGVGGRPRGVRSAPSCTPPIRMHILNYMVQYSHARLDASFAALSDATRRGVLEQLGRADASITDLAESST